jgi:hypothetical protein
MAGIETQRKGRAMSSPSKSHQTQADGFSLHVQTAGQWVHARLSAFRRAAERRRVLRTLQELRDRDPRLFEETGVDPNDLPPPAQSGVALFAQTVVAGYLFGDSRECIGHSGRPALRRPLNQASSRDLL